MLAPLPPSSRLTRLSESAAALEIRMPAREDPVKLTMSTSGCTESCDPTPTPSPFSMLNTPAGKPASCINSANRTPDKGAISEGFRMTVQPVAIAGIAFSTIWFIGQFQGVMQATTPIGSLSVISVFVYSESNSKSRNALMNPSRCQLPAPVCCARARFCGAPISMDIACAISSWRALYTSSNFSKSARRSSLEVCDQLSNAAFAAATAASVSA